MTWKDQAADCTDYAAFNLCNPCNPRLIFPVAECL
jgi:hypothetical protein